MVNDVNIWAVNDGEKIYKTDLKNNNKNHNSVWDGNKIAVFSGKNEVVAFQIIIENQGNLINDVRVDIAPFKKIDGDKGYYLKDYVEVFKEHYLYIPYDKITPTARLPKRKVGLDLSFK